MPEHLYECQLFLWVFFPPSLRRYWFSFLLTQGFNSSGRHIEFLHQEKLILWTCKAEIWGNFTRRLTLTFGVSLKAVFVWPIAKICPTNKFEFRTWQDKITFSRSFKGKPRYRDSKKTELFHLSGLLALPEGAIGINDMPILFQCCRCTNSVFLAIYVNNLVANMST